MGRTIIQKCLTTSKSDLTIPPHQRKRSESSKHDDWWTPKWLFSQLCALYKFKPRLDVACSLESNMCEEGIGAGVGKGEDALQCDWVYLGDDPDNYQVVDVWCNPPNSIVGKFILKAYEQFKKFSEEGMKIMMIIPTNTMSSKAFWNGIQIPQDNGERVFYKPIYKRIPFLEHGKPSKYGSARNAYLVVIWG